jgi:hypothetical protein
VKFYVAFFLIVLAGCSSVKVIEAHQDGGTLKYRRRGLTKESREEKAFAEADEHCKRNGFKTYKIANQVQDGRFEVVTYKCEN